MAVQQNQNNEKPKSWNSSILGETTQWNDDPPKSRKVFCIVSNEITASLVNEIDFPEDRCWHIAKWFHCNLRCLLSGNRPVHTWILTNPAHHLAVREIRVCCVTWRCHISALRLCTVLQSYWRCKVWICDSSLLVWRVYCLDSWKSGFLLYGRSTVAFSLYLHRIVEN